MADLNSLFKKATSNDSKDRAVQPPADTAPESKVGGAVEGGTESVSPASEAPKSTGSGVRNPFARRVSESPPATDGGTGDSPVPTGASDNDDGGKPTGLAALNLKRGNTDGDSSQVAAAPIQSLADLESSVDEGIAPRPGMSSFEDETPATKPTRELPDDLPKEQLQFIDLIDGVYEVLHEPDFLGSVIRNIMIELKNNPEYMRLVAPDDIRTWVRGMRESMGLARIKKTEAKVKRAGGTGKKGKTVDADMLADLASLGIE